MEKAYEYYKIAAFEDSYRVRSDTVAQKLQLNYGLLSYLTLSIAWTF